VGIGKLRFVELHFAAAFVFKLGSLIADTNHASIQLCAITIFTPIFHGEFEAEDPGDNS
jgi:hypothetical protein